VNASNFLTIGPSAEASAEIVGAITITYGLAACERLIAKTSGPFCFDGAPNLAGLCLVPQL
jgi:hypothetical protein